MFNLSSYRSQKLLENYGLLQFVNHEFLPENVDLINASDFQVLAQILDDQISWEFTKGHYNTVMALLETVCLLSKHYQQYVDLIISDLSQLYIYNLSDSIQREPEFVQTIVVELRQNILLLKLDQATVKDYLHRIIVNFPPNVAFSEDGFSKDILQLLDQKHTLFSSIF